MTLGQDFDAHLLFEAAYLLELALGDAETRQDWVGRIDGHQRNPAARCLNEVARFYGERAGAARDGCLDRAVFELNACLLDGRFIRLHDCFERFCRGHRDIVFLAGDKFALEQWLQARLLGTRIFKLRLVAGKLGQRLVVLRLKSPRIDLKKQLARFYDIALLEQNGLQHAAHLRANLDAVLGLNRADRLDHHGHRFGDGLRGSDGKRAAALTLAFALLGLGLRRGARLLGPVPISPAGDSSDHREDQHHRQSFHFLEPAAAMRSLNPVEN